MPGPNRPAGHVVASAKLPNDFPTHLHSADFWEELGRAVGAFGFLEETLGKAIFAFTATREVSEDEVERTLSAWLPTLQRAISEPLGGLIDAYGKAVRDNKAATITNLDDLLIDLREAATMRNVLCHSSWRAPDEQGRSKPFFFDKKLNKFDVPVDVAYLRQVRLNVVKLTCDVINTVTHMGWAFPGSVGPGKAIMGRD